MEKSTGVEFDREAFLPASQPPPSAVGSLKGILLLLLGVAAIAVVSLLGYQAITQDGGHSSTDTRELVQLDLQIAQIKDRLDHLEQENRRLAGARSLASSPKPAALAQSAPPSTPARVVYRVTPSIPQGPSVATPDPATTQRLAALQKDVGSAQEDANANREAWQATADRLADVAGQVGSEHGEILRGEDELNQLLAQTERSALPFELRRGASPEQLGPVTIALKATNPKNQRYTVCVYIQNSCVELKDRTLYEVVQVALSRNAPPLQVIATTVGKDGITGYLEIPRSAGP
jgi:hypothetical protein